MASYHHRSSTNDRAADRHSKQCRHSHDKHVTDDMGRNSSHRSRSRVSHQPTNDPDSDSSDEILIKGRASRRFRHHVEQGVARQPKSIDKAQRRAHRTSSSSSQEIEVYYVADATKSGSPPVTKSRQSQSQSRSSNSSKSAGISASDITGHLKGITKSWLGRRSDDSHKSSRRSRSHSKHEKREKHGKKRVSTSKFLAPLAQRWVCYKCGKLRSDTIQQRHPIKEGQKMQPNWCGKCRVHGELHGRRLVFDNQRHYCWGCGIVRSKTYHMDNPINDHENSTPNYCKPCREVSPAFDYNLREASEAFYRQMHEADLSDVGEEEDGLYCRAPGKENQKPESEKKLKASNSFILENCSYRVKTTSDSSSEGHVPLSILKALHLDEQRVRSTSGGGCRLSDGSYRRPTIECVVDEKYKPGLKTTRVTKETLSTIDGADDHQIKQDGQTSGDGELSSPTVIFAPKKQYDSSDSCTKKKVHWIKRADQPMTADSNTSDSAYCSGYPSDLSYKSAGSRRSRRGPGDVSTGSPPIQQGESTTGDLRRDIPRQASSQRSESRGKGFRKDLPVHKTFGVPPHVADTNTASHRRDSIQSTHAVPSSPPDSFVPMNNGFKGCTGQDGYESVATPWIESPEITNFSRPYMSPTKQDAEVSPNFSRPFLSPPKLRANFSHDSNPDCSSGFGTRPGYMQEYSPYQSAAHFSDSTQSRDFSGFSAPGEAQASFQNECYGTGVRHGDWPPPSCPIYEDHATYAEGYDGEYFASSGDSAHFAPSSGYSSFDFSGFGGPSTSNANCGDGTHPEGEKFVRKKTAQSTPRQHSWHLYDDGDDEESAPDTAACEWRKDGRTTVHRSGGGQVPNDGKTVQILSIREIDNDEELAIHEDNDEASELDTVIGDDSVMKSICAA